ncbi:hypothetical protein KY343_00100 [Candidatus Woesearchaeota archaeon]|nr:hypothetical protein [Candidatus Woesearchaeota archaeon]
MIQKKDIPFNKVKSLLLTLIFAITVLVFAVNIAKVSQENIIGRAFYSPIQVYGTIEPALPDGTIISFRLNGIEVLTASLKNNSYGYKEKLYLNVDDESTIEKEGYKEGDVVGVYIEDVKVADLSYFEPGPNEKYFNIPVSIRNLITIKAAYAAIERGCMPNWQCEEWSECINSIQTRICIDVNECDTEKEKPEEQVTCEMPAEKTFGIIDMITFEFILSIVLFIILMISLGFLIRKVVKEYRKGKPKKKRTRKKKVKKRKPAKKKRAVRKKKTVKRKATKKKR